MRSLQVAVLPFDIATAPHNVASANMQEVHSHPITQVIDADTEQYWPKNNTSNPSSVRFFVVADHPLSLAAQPCKRTHLVRILPIRQ